MRVGIQLPEVEREVRWPEYLAMAQAAEEVGFDSIWLGDHLLYDGAGAGAVGGVDAAERAGGGDRAGDARAARGVRRRSTRRGCWPRWRRRSTRSAAGASCSGSASGWNRREFDAFGIPYDKRVSRFEEAFAIIRGLLRGERVTLDGTYHRADDVVLLPQAGAPDAADDRLQRAADARHRRSRTSQAWNTWWDDYGNTPEGFARS